MKPVRIAYSLDRAAANGNEIRCNVDVMTMLREAGVPVLGCISIQGVEHGKLSIERDRTFNEMIYTWEPEPEADPAADL